MQNKALEEIKNSLKTIGAPSSPEEVHVSGSEPFTEARTVELGKSNIKSNDGFNLLGAILETAFFYTFFEYIADRQFSSKTRQLRVAKMKIQHPYVYQFCIVADVVVRVIVVLAIVAAGLYSVYKVLK